MQEIDHHGLAPLLELRRQKPLARGAGGQAGGGRAQIVPCSWVSAANVLWCGVML